MIIAFIIWTIVAVLFLLIGISARKSKEPIGFFSFVKPPAVKDTKGYNNAVSNLWFAVAVLFEIMGIPFLFLEQNSPFFFLMVFGVVGLLIGMMIAYNVIESRYK